MLQRADAHHAEPQHDAGLVVKAVDSLNEDQLAQVQAIYDSAFSPDMRAPFTELTRPGRAGQMLVAMEGKVPAGFAALRLLSSLPWPPESAA
jgi:hypothetical protein